MKLSAEQFDLIEEIASGEGSGFRTYPSQSLPSRQCFCVSGEIPKFLFALGRRLNEEGENMLADMMYECMRTDNICGEGVVYFPRIEAWPEDDEDNEEEEVAE